MEDTQDELLQITQLAADIRSIDPGQDPSSLLRQIGKGSDETVWTALLGYFLNPDADHGLGTAFLTQYLQELHDAGVGPVDPATTPISEAEVVIEPYAGGRRADVLIHRPNDWFVLIEGKVGAEIGSNQLISYINSDRIGSGVDVPDIPDSRQCYVFLTLPSRESEPIPSAFHHQTWDCLLTCINEVRNDPALSHVTQSKLNEFAITIEQTMTNHDIDRQTQLEYTMLFNEYRDAIEKAQKGPQRLAEEVRAEWPDVVRSERCNPETWANSPEDDDWHAKDSGADNSHIFRTNWKTDPRILDLHLEIEPTPALNMRKVYERSRFRICLQSHKNDKARPLFKEKFYEVFEGDERYNDTVYIKPQRHQQMTFTETKFEFELGEPEQGYYSRLADALDGHAEFAKRLDSIVAEVRDEYQSTD